MSKDWRTSVCQSPFSSKLIDASVIAKNINHPHASPIDRFYASRKRLLLIGKPESLASDGYLGCLLLVGIISATEMYFREVFAQILKTCPVARKTASDQNIQLGAVFWHLNENRERAAFEGHSFASSKNIISTCSTYTGITLPRIKGGLFDEFDKLCEIRHGIVHGNCHLPGKNASILDIEASNKTLVIEIDFDMLQSAAYICTGLIIEQNLKLFDAMAKRWATEWRDIAHCKKDNSDALFDAIWSCFFSKNDSESGTTSGLTKGLCKAAIQKEFGSSWPSN